MTTTNTIPDALSHVLYTLNELATQFGYHVDVGVDATDEDSISILASGSVYSLVYLPSLGMFEIESFCPNCDEYPETVLEIPASEVVSAASAFLGFLVGEAIDNYAAEFLEQR